MLAWKLGADYAAIQSPLVWKICANPAVEAAVTASHAGFTGRFSASEERAGQRGTRWNT